jgi:hypothetical protein
VSGGAEGRSPAAAAPAWAARQYRQAYDLVAAAREPSTGAYADGVWLQPGGPGPMGSIAAVGVGLIALALADREGWEPEAGRMAQATLDAFLGRRDGFRPARDPGTGFLAHFFDLRSGARWAASEFSTMDTALLVAGARFAGRYFGGGVAAAAERLYRSVDWGAAVGAAGDGVIYMTVDGGRPARPSRPFNEYAVVAWLAREAGVPAAREAWERVFAPERLDQLPQARWDGVRVLTDDPAGRRFLSSFVHLFPYYLVSAYTRSPVYARWLQAACLADRLYWRAAGAPPYAWGAGAGASGPDGRGYHADAVGRTPGGVVSPHIVAGFLPVYPDGLQDLVLAAEHLGVAAGAGRCPAGRFGLHRFVAVPGGGYDAGWCPGYVPLVDHSTLLYGLAAWRHGPGFFARYSG